MNERTIARAVILRDGHVLLLRRAPNERIAPGIWQCPAGKQENDETIEQTLARELREETGLEVLKAIPVDTMSTVFETEGKLTNWHQYSFLVTTTNYNIILSSEHDDFCWVKISDIDNFAELAEPVKSAIAHAVTTQLTK